MIQLRKISPIAMSSGCNISRMSSVSGANIYLHWPYCIKKCTYCNFNKYLNLNVDVERMVKCLLDEWKQQKKVHSIESADTLFFGGGTPSLLPMPALSKLVNKITNGTAIEVSLEGNPGDLVDKISDLADCGVTRLSIGVQALSDKDLKMFNRDHTCSQSFQAIEQSLEHFPVSTSVDLIFGRPGQSLQSWMSDLEQILSLGLPHVSLYQLTVERGTKLWHQVQRKDLTLPEEELITDMYLEGVKLLEAKGLRRYEVSNFSRKGSECLHNQGYWRGNRYLGLGPGAHSRTGFGQSRHAAVNIPVPGTWCKSVESVGHGVISDKIVGIKEGLTELLATGLRTTRGIEIAEWERACEHRVCIQEFVQLVSEHGAEFDLSILRLNEDRIALVDHLLPYFLVALDEINLVDR